MTYESKCFAFMSFSLVLNYVRQQINYLTNNIIPYNRPCGPVNSLFLILFKADSQKTNKEKLIHAVR